jgi:hypothetical protein
MSDSLFDRIVSEIESVFEPIVDAIQDPGIYEMLLQSLGVAGNDAASGGILAAVGPLADLSNEIATIGAAGSPSFADIAHVLKSARDAFTAIEAMDAGGGASSSLGGLAKDLIKALVIGRLAMQYPLLYDLLVLVTIIEPPENAQPTATVSADGGFRRMPVFFPEFRFERLSALFSNPANVLRAAYVNGLATVDDANAMADLLFGRLANVLVDLSIPHAYGVNDSERALLGDAATLVDHGLLIYLQSLADGATVDGGVTLALSSADRGDLGLVVTPFGGVSYTVQSDNWTITSSLTADITAFAYGKHGATIVASAGAAEVDVSIAATLAAPDGGPAFVFGSSSGSRLELGGAKLALDATLSEAAQTFGFDAAVSKAAIVISGGDGDGFVSSLIPQDGLRTDFDFGIAWSNTGGLAFHGAASLDATIPLNVSLGGTFLIPTAHIGLLASDTDLSLEISASVGLAIGPVQALVDRLGVLTEFDFSSGSGSAGVGDVSIAFKPPSGVGLTIDAAGVSGGGFLEYDPAKSEYQGVLQLQFDNLALQAFGLITTQVAGASGYSLLALVDANFPPIALGWGFTLNGVGGLLAMHRTADTDALGAALRADKLGTILFPKAAIANAPAVLAELDTLFPAAAGRFVFGPMALIGWGTPTLLTVALAIVLELPEPIRIVLLARLAARLPSAAHALISLNVDALGVLDIDADSLALDAVLYDSHLVTFALSGSMALRVKWGSQPQFALAIGGFHPQFTPPPGFPALRRITVDMPSGHVAKMRLAAYLAITSNTVQFGADLDVFIGVSGYGLAGHLGFDTLFQIDPFAFAADISATVALVAGGDDLMSVKVDGKLSGPSPWTIAGSFSIDLLFFSLSKSFSYAWGSSDAAPAIAPVDASALLSTAFADPRSWGAALPAGTPPLVSLRANDGTVMVAHPLAQLSVHQTVVPLDLTIERIGAAPLSGTTTFTITGFTIGGSSVAHASLQEDFAPAQFFNLTDAEKLARPSFELHDAGASIGAIAASCGPALAKTIAFETFYVDTPGGAPRTDAAPRSDLVGLDLLAIAGFGASGGAAIRRAGAARYAFTGTPVNVAPLRFVVADTTTLSATSVGTATGAAYAFAAAALATAVAATPSRAGQLQIVATYEMGTAA